MEKTVRGEGELRGCCEFVFFDVSGTTELSTGIHPLSLQDALPVSAVPIFFFFLSKTTHSLPIFVLGCASFSETGRAHS